MSHRTLRLICSLILLFSARPATAQCLGWSRIFAPDGVNGSVLATAVFDDGHGPALYVGGSFNRAGAITAHSLARWNGLGWLDANAGGGNTSIDALCVFDDGSGPALYAGGSLTNMGDVPAANIAKWNGTSWSALGSGVDGYVLAL